MEDAGGQQRRSGRLAETAGGLGAAAHPAGGTKQADARPEGPWRRRGRSDLEWRGRGRGAIWEGRGGARGIGDREVSPQDWRAAGGGRKGGGVGARQRWDGIGRIGLGCGGLSSSSESLILAIGSHRWKQQFGTLLCSRASIFKQM